MEGRIINKIIKEKKLIIISVLWFLSTVVFVSYFYPVYRDIKKGQQDLAALEEKLVEISYKHSVEKNLAEEIGRIEEFPWGEEDEFFLQGAEVLFQRLESVLQDNTLETSTLYLENIYFPQDSSFGWMVMVVEFLTFPQELVDFIGEIQKFCPCINIESFQIQREEHLYSGRIRVKTCFLNAKVKEGL